MITGEQVYLPALQGGQSRITIEGSEFHHLIRVRRYDVGDEIWVVNGQGLGVLTCIESIEQESLVLKINQEVLERGEMARKITLVVANLKGDHLELVTEKATELGVQEIVPLLTDHTIKKGLNRDRLERIAIAAMKQSRRSRLPIIRNLTPFHSFVQQQLQGIHLFCYADDSSQSILEIDKIHVSEEIFIWIGPEGDWSKDEIDLASFSNYTFTGLGPRRLRAETAAIHAVGILSAILQDPS
ncbi:MAG: 16S rRNA (uracil(1498)-N(3))-methyltransferase [Candidatus Marinimicrobia bacterium]|nr:16S rRNA (uracil(1498)-N(3))-methyltransferase [Candidatus Neomarinimicrobiota bacterium]